MVTTLSIDVHLGIGYTTWYRNLEAPLMPTKGDFIRMPLGILSEVERALLGENLDELDVRLMPAKFGLGSDCRDFEEALSILGWETRTPTVG